MAGVAAGALSQKKQWVWLAVSAVATAALAAASRPSAAVVAVVAAAVVGGFNCLVMMLVLKGAFLISLMTRHAASGHAASGLRGVISPLCRAPTMPTLT